MRLLSERRCAAVLTPGQVPLVVMRGSRRLPGALGEQAVVSQPVKQWKGGQAVEAPAPEESWACRRCGPRPGADCEGPGATRGPGRAAPPGFPREARVPG